MILTRQPNSPIETATLLFYVTCENNETLPRIWERLQVDYSPARSEGNLEDLNGWFVASRPIYIAEFSSTIRYCPIIEKLFESGSSVSITPAYLTENQMVAAGDPADGRSMLIGTNAWARVIIYKGPSGEIVEADPEFCSASGAMALFSTLGVDSAIPDAP